MSRLKDLNSKIQGQDWHPRHKEYASAVVAQVLLAESRKGDVDEAFEKAADSAQIPAGVRNQIKSVLLGS